jgi:chemotaxis protein methyltransferase CheR
LSPQLDRFRRALATQLGLAFDDAKEPYLSQVLGRRLAATRETSSRYLDSLEHTPPAAELRELAKELTVGETYFFRHLEQFRALFDVLEPKETTDGVQQVRLLSAGCASGEEPYTLAMAAKEWLGAKGWAVSIRAVDVNPEALAKAASGRYSAWSLRETPPSFRERWFRPDGKGVVLADEVRASVLLEEKNLLADDPQLWAPAAYDAIFCRNALMYFEPLAARAVVAKLARSLAPGGHLFLGHAETLRGLSNDFHLRHTHDTFYYQLKRGAPAPLASQAPPALEPAAEPEPRGDRWYDSIHRASKRVAALAQPGPSPQVPALSGWNVAEAQRLIERERYEQGIELLRALPAEAQADPEVLLLKAVALFQRGELALAEQTCRAVLANDELNAGAHHLLALCRDGAHDEPGAKEQDRVAVYLDPGFAMPRLHLGMLARRGGDLPGAHRELSQALWLLEREEPSRLSLYSGGFGRQALISICQQELLRCGAPR